MSYYRPKYFRPQEWFSEEVINKHMISGTRTIHNKIWRLVDGRIIWTMDKIREYFDCPFTMNDYLWGGGNQYRGFRSFEELVSKSYLKVAQIRSHLSSFTSQHCFGRGADSKPKGITPQEIRADIRQNPNADRYQYITGVETGITWLHLDVRNWDTLRGDILFFKP